VEDGGCMPLPPVGWILACTGSKDGYIWLGTQKGLVRFDGFEFKSLSENA
jgi:ligand-binding sensor domain-containing protein